MACSCNGTCGSCRNVRVSDCAYDQQQACKTACKEAGSAAGGVAAIIGAVIGGLVGGPAGAAIGFFGAGIPAAALAESSCKDSCE